MIKWLIKSQNEFRVETMSDVEAFHKDLQEKASNEGYTLSSFSWVEKEIKEKGEVVDTYYQVKCTFIFNAIKDPENPFTKVEYPIYEQTTSLPADSGDPEVFEDDTTKEEWF